MIRFRSRRIAFAALVLLYAFAVVPLVLADQTEAASSIALAEQQIAACFTVAKDAEGAGANITSLTLALNDATSILSDAELAFSHSDFDGARDLAVQSHTRLAGFVQEANTLTVAHLQQSDSDVIVSIVGVCVILGVGIGVWFLLGRLYALPRGVLNES